MEKEKAYEFDIKCPNCKETSSSKEYAYLGNEGDTLFFKCPKCEEPIELDRVKLSAWLDLRAKLEKVGKLPVKETISRYLSRNEGATKTEVKNYILEELGWPEDWCLKYSECETLDELLEKMAEKGMWKEKNGKYWLLGE